MNNESLIHTAAVVLTHGLDDPLEEVLGYLSEPHVVAVNDDRPVLYLARQQAVSNDEVNLKVGQINQLVQLALPFF